MANEDDVQGAASRRAAHDHGARPPRRLWIATGWQLGARLCSSVGTLATFALLARDLEADALGRVAFWLAAFLAVESFVDLGSGAVVMRRSAADGAALPALLVAGRRLRTWTAAIAFLGFGGGALLAREPGALWIGLAATYYFTWSLELSPIVLKNELSYGTVSAARVLAAVLRLVFVAALLALGVHDAGPQLVALTASAGIANVWVHRRSLPHLPPSHGQVAAARGVFAQAWPLGLAGLCQQVYFHVDNVFVRVHLGDEAVGRYFACMRLMGFSILGAQYVAASALPWLVRRAPHGGLARAALRLAVPAVLLAAPFYGVVAAYAGDVLALVFGADFASEAHVLVWLLRAGLAVHVGALLHTALVASGAQRAALAVSASALALNVLANAYAVPRFGLAGAAAVTLATEAFVALASWVALARCDAGARSWSVALVLLAPLVFELAYGFVAAQR
jgi:O-antigen/teichoic acid export membrane protein